jgi:hypothetical protein
MRIDILCLSFLLLAPPVSAEAPKGQTVRTLANFTSRIMTDGTDGPMDDEPAKKLGLEMGLPTRTILYSPVVAPDHQVHAFQVVMKGTPAGLKPVALVWTVSGSKKGWLLRLSPTGILERAMRTTVKTGAISEVPKDAPEAKETLGRERRFYLKDSLGLPFPRH